MRRPKQITTTIADVEVVYHYIYSPGSPERGRFGPIESYDPGDGSYIDLEGPFIGDTDIGPIVDLIPEPVMRQIIERLYEQIELAEADSREDARHAADEDRYERLRYERDGV